MQINYLTYTKSYIRHILWDWIKCKHVNLFQQSFRDIVLILLNAVLLFMIESAVS